MNSPAPMHPNLINAAYMQMRNSGQNYVGFLGKHPITIDEWKRDQIRRWEDHMDDELCKL